MSRSALRLGWRDGPGPKSRDLRQRESRWLSPGVQQIATLSGLAFERGDGALLYDVDGNAYVDLVAGVCVASLGHGHPRYAAALAEQVAQLSVGSFTSKARVELLEALAEVAPAGLTRLQLFSGGAEAVEAAIRLAKSVTCHHEVISFWGGFHGKTGGILGNMGSAYKHGLGPLAPGAYVSPYPDPYRPPLQSTDLVATCLDFLEKKIQLETTGRIAAILVEPVQGTAGNVFPPTGWLPGLKALAQRHGALLIADEMITGFGRTGRMFGLERDAIQPDVITIGKGFGAGFPVTGLLTTDAHATAEPYALPSGSSSSYGGNPLASAAALAAIRITREDDLVGNSRRMGERLLGHLRGFEERYSFVGRVEGEGLMIRLELVADKTSKRPIDKAICRQVFLECLGRGLVTMAYSAAVRINPPLVIDADLVDAAASILQDVFDRIEDQHFSGNKKVVSA